MKHSPQTRIVNMFYEAVILKQNNIFAKILNLQRITSPNIPNKITTTKSKLNKATFLVKKSFENTKKAQEEFR